MFCENLFRQLWSCGDNDCLLHSRWWFWPWFNGHLWCAEPFIIVPVARTALSSSVLPWDEFTPGMQCSHCLADMRSLRDCSRTWPDHLAQPAPPASRDHWLLIKSPASLIMRLRCFLRSVSSKDWVDGPVLIKEKCPIRSLDSWMFNKSSQLSCREAVPLLDHFQLINSYTGIKHG